MFYTGVPNALMISWCGSAQSDLRVSNASRVCPRNEMLCQYNEVILAQTITLETSALHLPYGPEKGSGGMQKKLCRFMSLCIKIQNVPSGKKSCYWHGKYHSLFTNSSGWNRCLEISQSNLPAQAWSPRVGCPELRLVGVLTVFTDGDSTTFMSSVFQCLSTLIVWVFRNSFPLP